MRGTQAIADIRTQSIHHLLSASSAAADKPRSAGTGSRRWRSRSPARRMPRRPLSLDESVLRVPRAPVSPDADRPPLARVPDDTHPTAVCRAANGRITRGRQLRQDASA